MARTASKKFSTMEHRNQYIIAQRWYNGTTLHSLSREVGVGPAQVRVVWLKYLKKMRIRGSSRRLVTPYMQRICSAKEQLVQDRSVQEQALRRLEKKYG